MGENLIDIIKSCKEGNKDGILLAIKQFEPLIRKYEKILDYEDARYDLYEKFIVMLLKIPRITNKYEILSYIKKTMHREYINLSIKHQKYINHVILTDLFDETSYCPDIKFQIQDIKSALNKLNSSQKQIILYKFFKGYKVNQIALKLGISRQAVYKNEQIALVILKDLLA